jgi:Tfp pilus assembly protein PilX
MTLRDSYYYRQGGAALITALVMLVILTLLGMAAMNTTSLEEKMALNMQQEFASFHASESGYNQAFSVTDSIVYEQEKTMQITVPDGTVVDVKTNYRQNTPPPMKTDAMYSASQFQAAHFDVHSTASVNKSQSSVRGGIYQIIPGSYSN